MIVPRLVGLALAFMAMAPTGWAQEEQPKTGAPGFVAIRDTPVEVRAVITQRNGDKTVKRLPYSFLVRTDSNGAMVRIGRDVLAPSSEVRYENLGMNIDCAAQPITEAGRVPVRLTVDYRWIEADSTGKDQFTRRSFRSVSAFVLRDGESRETSTTDPLTGEVFTVEATLRLVKQ